MLGTLFLMTQLTADCKDMGVVTRIQLEVGAPSINIVLKRFGVRVSVRRCTLGFGFVLGSGF